METNLFVELYVMFKGYALQFLNTYLAQLDLIHVYINNISLMEIKKISNIWYYFAKKWLAV